MAATKSTNEELIERTCDAMNERDEAAFRALQHPEIVHRQGRDVLHGVDAVTDHVWAMLEAFPDLTVTPEDFVAADDVVALYYTARGTHEGEFEGIPPTGNEVEVSEMKMYRIRDGKVAEVWGVADRLGMLAQLGVVEPPA